MSWWYLDREYRNSTIHSRLFLPTNKSAPKIKRYEKDMNRGLKNLFEEIGYDPNLPECPIRDDYDRVKDIMELDFRGTFVNRRSIF